MLRLIRGEMDNFRSFAGHHEFEYAASGMHWIQGVNADSVTDTYDEEGAHSVGSGKSTFLSLPMYALFGVAGKMDKTTKKDRVITKRIGTNHRVSLDFEGDDGRRWRIERHRRHHEYGNKLRLLVIDNKGDVIEDASCADFPDTQRLVEEIVGYSPQVFRKAVILGRDDMVQFLDLGAPERGRMFEALARLSRLKSFHDRVRQRRRDAENERATAAGEVTALAAGVRKFKDMIDVETKRVEREVTTAMHEVSVLEDELIALTSAFGDPEAAVTTVTALYPKAVDAAALVVVAGVDASALAAAERSLAIALKTVAAAEKECVRVEAILAGLAPQTCDACGAIVGAAEFKSRKSDAMAAVTSALDRFRDAQAHADDVNDHAVAAAAKAEASKAVADAAVKETMQIGKDLPDDVFAGIVEDAEAGRPNAAVEELGGIAEKLEAAKAKLLAIASPAVDGLKVAIQKMAVEWKQMKAVHDAAERVHAMAEWWCQALDMSSENSMKQYVMSDIIPVFNMTLQQNLDRVYNGAMSVQFDAFFRERIEYGGDTFEYDELSTGEAVKVNLAVNLAIFDLARINLSGSSAIFLDEIFTNVDEPTIASFLGMIRDKYAGESAVYVVSHQREVEEHMKPLTRTVVRKENGGSRLVVGGAV